MKIVLVIIFASLVLLISAKYGRRLPRPYRFRTCEGRGWRLAFPSASKNEIRSFLLLLVSAFAFADKDKLKFRPEDKISDIYRALYPGRWMPDALEMETLERDLRKRYAPELSSIWRDELTLGDIFSRIRA